MVTVTNLARARRTPMGERGEQMLLVNPEMGARHLDLHVNTLRSSGPDGIPITRTARACTSS